MKIYVLLPAFNEQDSIPRLLPKIHSVLSNAGYSYQLVVTDDGSTDDTNKLLIEASRSYPLYLISHSVNRGLVRQVVIILKQLQCYQLKTMLL